MTERPADLPPVQVRTDHALGLALLGCFTAFIAVLLHLYGQQDEISDSAEVIAATGRWSWFLAGSTVVIWVGAAVAHAVSAHTTLLLANLEALRSGAAADER